MEGQRARPDGSQLRPKHRKWQAMRTIMAGLAEFERDLSG